MGELHHVTNLPAEGVHVFTICGEKIVVVLQCMQREGVDVSEALGVGQSSTRHVETNMEKKRAGIQGVGFVAQPGVRYRLWDPSDAESKVGHCAHFHTEKYLSYLHKVQSICNKMMAGAMRPESQAPEMRSIVDDIAKGTSIARECGLEHGGTTPGGASAAHPSVQIGVNSGAVMHLDSHDASLAIWGVTGREVAFCLGQAQTMLHLPAGCVMAFPASKVWHCMPRCHPNVMMDANFSRYFNKKQVVHLLEEGERRRGGQ